jgi:hypothetical protein
MAASEPVAQPNAPHQQNDRPFAWIRGLGKFRDGLLVLVTVVYVLGYLVWSIHAWVNNLGLLPALEPQYLAAGIPLALILSLAWLGYKVLKRILEKIQVRLNLLLKRHGILCRGFAFLCVVGSLFLFHVAEKYKLPTIVSAEQARSLILKDNMVTFAAAVLLLLGLWVFGSTGFARVLALFYFFLYLSLAIVLYMFGIYPHLRQEFGGLRPRCAYVDLVRDQVSEPLQKQLLPESAIQSKVAVQRSVRLQVFFSGSEFMLIKPNPENGNPSNRPNLVELRKPATQAIEWCD